MVHRIPWDKHEAVLLLEAFLTAEDGLITEKEAHRYVSQVLRQKALLRGLEVDENYRNINGIRMQMDGLKHLYSQGVRGLSHGNKLFEEVLELYRNHRKEFRLLLTEANELAGLHLYQEIPHPER